MICKSCRRNWHGAEPLNYAGLPCPATISGQPDEGRKTQCDCQHKPRKGEK